MRWLHGGQGLVEVGDEVVFVFDAHGETDKALGDADGLTFFIAQREVGCGGGVGG